MLVGYARVSSSGQSLDVQLEALKDAECEEIFAEKRTGTSTTGRTELNNALSFVRKGDTLVVTRLDRLARSAADLHRIVRQLTEKGVAFQCLQQSSIDTTTSTAKLLLGVLASIAEFEADIRRERQREGIERAKAAGVYKGRKPTVDAAQVRALRNQGLGGTEIAKKLGIARASVYRALNAGN
uniref:recombinase family protein n=1 Tax=Altererythrobacter segetis TaxID=1104773 RepID=UPI00140B6E91|nr:recombinase family protein [Altererythrobacter segetis]